MIKQRREDIVHVSPDGPYRHQNPFEADIAFNYDCVEVTGSIVIKPPLELDADYREGLEHDLGGYVVQQISSTMGTLYRFSCDPDEMYGRGPEDRTIAAVQQVINEAGALASLDILAHVAGASKPGI